MKVLEIGPDPYKAHGGMSNYIKNVVDNPGDMEIDYYGSYVDGSNIRRLVHSALWILGFCLMIKKYDVYHIHMSAYASTFREGWYAKFLSKRNRKVVLHIHAGSFISIYKISDERTKQYIRNLWGYCDRVIVLSEKFKTEMVREFGLSNVEVIKNGVDTNLYEKGINKTEDYRDKFIFLGKVCSEKGINEILEAVKSLAKKYASLVVYIAGPGGDWIEEYARKNNLNEQLKYLGWIDDDKKVEIFKKTGVLLLPSYSEGVPISILEGIAAGKAIIATDVGGIPDIANVANVILIPPKDTDALENAMKRVINDRDLVRACSADNIEYAEKISLEHTFYQLHELYRNVAREV